MVEIFQFGLRGLLVCVGALAVSIPPTFAQLTPDNTLGKERSQVIPINTNNDRIEGGAARGSNLFHSFQDFNVGVGRSVYFANPQGITNIFSRVTGSNSSNIFGELGVLGDANLFLLNPNGILFGKNAQLDIRGSFMGTTANSLVFPNGVEFSATNPQAPPLLSINVPIGLQFGSQPGSITSQAVIRNSQGNAVGGLSVGTGSTLALMGGEIALDGSYLSTQNGQVKLGAVGRDTTVGLNVNGSSLGFNFPENFRRTPINLTNGSIFATGGNSGIELFGGKIGLNGKNSYILSVNGGSIVVDATQFNLDNGFNVASITSGAAKGGDVTINAGKITITGDGTVENSGKISTWTNGKGNGGNLIFNATESVNVNGGLIFVSSGGAGNAGNLTVRATDAVNITNQGNLLLSSSSSGSTGNLRIETGTLRVQNNFSGRGVVALASGGGNVGSISIQARNAVDLTKSDISTVGGTTPATAGDITIQTQRLNLKDGSNIRTTTLSNANAANIFIKASEYVDIGGSSHVSSDTGYGSGNGGNVTIETPLLSLTQGSYVSSLTGFGSGNAGNVTIETPRLSLTQSGHISTSSLESSGNAGNITIHAKDVELDGGLPHMSDSDISSDVSGSNADARGGTITIDTERLRLSNGGNISTLVQGGRGQGGNLVVHATDSIDITGVGLQLLNGSFAPSGLFAGVQTGGIGSGGSIDVTTGRLNLSNGGQISAATFNQGNAGNIGINAEQIDLRGHSFIVTGVNDKAKGNGGNISIKTQLLNLQEESEISSGTFGNGNAGNLTVQADNIILTGSDSGFLTGIKSGVEEGGNGRGGDINITTNNLDIRHTAEISSGTFGNGNAGNLTVKADNIILTGSDSEFLTGITSSVQEGANGKGGDIYITTNNFNIHDNAEIFSGSIGTGDAGDIRINANFLEILGKGSAIASFTNAGNGGGITLNIADLLLLRRGGLISTTAGRSEAGGNGGNININSKFIVAIPKENSDISANAYTGTGGKVQINSQGIFGIEPRPKPTEKSDITASSALGVSGVIKINAPDTNSIQNSFTGFSPNVIDTNALIANSCISRSPKQDGTFFITGSGALRNSPNDASISIYSTGEVRNVNDNTSPTWKKGDAIVEPQGVYRLADGRLVLSRECK